MTFGVRFSSYLIYAWSLSVNQHKLKCILEVFKRTLNSPAVTNELIKVLISSLSIIMINNHKRIRKNAVLGHSFKDLLHKCQLHVEYTISDSTVMDVLDNIGVCLIMRRLIW